MSYDPSTKPPAAPPTGAPGTWDGFLTTLSDRFTTNVSELNAELSETLALLMGDPSNPQYLANYQSKLSEYTLFRNAQSNVVKVYKDVGSAIIANFR